VLVENSRNRLTTEAVARLLWAIDRRQVVSRNASSAMLRLLARDPRSGRPERLSDNQILGFFGEGLPDGSRLWSKAGWTSKTRHDAAIIRLPDDRRIVLVAFTEGRQQADNMKLLPFIARRTTELIGAKVR
jgi:hypothetical protein